MHFFRFFILVLPLFGFFNAFAKENSEASQPMAQSLNHAKAVVFDFGGVVAQANIAPIVNLVAQYFQLTRKDAAHLLHQLRDAKSTGESEEKFWGDYARSKGKQLTSDWPMLWENAKLDAIEEIPGTLNIVHSLKDQGYIVGMLSNVTEDHARLIRKRGYYDLFSPVLLSYEIDVSKPDPRAYEILLLSLNLPANEVIFIDDKIENITSARNMGIDGILFLSPTQLQNELLKRDIDTQHELKKPNRVFSLIFPSKK